ncbi:hypothetical protein KEJ45_07040 [Candidatus Bathyarchaeota archaeon]|nr:hypothetical protein [Candidatus Bathyarchaeota archaeon]
MVVEDKITEYLTQYGIVREADIIAYCKNGYTERAVKKALEKLEKQGIIERIIHDKLKPVGIYFRLKREVKTSRLKIELDQIKQDYINKKIEQAFRRLHLLLVTEMSNLTLPDDLEKELRDVSLEFKQRIAKMEWRGTLEIMLPKFIETIGKICKQLEKVESQVA